MSVYRTMGPLVLSVSMGILVFFTEMFIEQSSTFYKTFVKIPEFDW